MNELPKQPDDTHRHININEDAELRYWSNKLKISIAALRDVIKEVGNSVGAIRARIGPADPSATSALLTIK